ncbi:hypothetical protein QYZ46_26650 [Vibrio parahaemolyticus]|nr:hypothetical protein [Vibrio parahaemolyticus]MDN4723938.1 hypothetical protein [Vibrio parahaemolyticus]
MCQLRQFYSDDDLQHPSGTKLRRRGAANPQLSQERAIPNPKPQELEEHGMGRHSVAIAQPQHHCVKGQSISFAMANMNQQFEQLFGGTEAYQEQSIADMNSVAAYQQQGHALRDTAQSSLALAQQMSQYQVDDHQTVASIQSHVQGADGAMEIAQANAELLAQLAQQLQKLQTLMQTQIQMSATQMAADADTTERQRVAEEKCSPNRSMWTQPMAKTGHKSGNIPA